jgi:hypothetical protein
VVKHVYAAELRIDVAAVATAAVNAVLVAHQGARGRKGCECVWGGGGAETSTTPCESSERETGNAVARARISRTRKLSAFNIPTYRVVGAVQNFVFSTEIRITDRGRTSRHHHHAPETPGKKISPAEILLNSPVV